MRRRTLLAGAGAAIGATAGCLGVGDGGSDADAGDGSEDGDGGLVLPAVEAAGSPGGEVGIRPPDRAVLLDFFATWCPPCEPEMEHLRAVRERYADEELFVVSITQESDEAAIAAFWREHDGSWPVVRDPDLAATRRYDADRVPTIVVLAPDGTETLRHVGLAGEERLREGVAAALAG